jgi:hypothetical protein
VFHLEYIATERGLRVASWWSKRTRAQIGPRRECFPGSSQNQVLMNASACRDAGIAMFVALIGFHVVTRLPRGRRGRILAFT